MLTRSTKISYVMDQQAKIIELVNKDEYKKAHDMRDQLFVDVVTYLAKNMETTTKWEMADLLNVLLNLEDWGI